MAAERSDMFNVFPGMCAPKMKYHDVTPAGEIMKPKTEPSQENLHNESRTNVDTVKARLGGLECNQSRGGVKKESTMNESEH
jgi:hypothetical protein